MRSLIQRSKAETGQGLIEYALILVMVALVVIAALTILGPNIQQAFCTVIRQIGAETPPQCSDSVLAIVSASYTPTPPRVTISATYNGGYNDSVIVSAVPGGMMTQSGSQYRITFTHTCPCTIQVRASTGENVSVNLP